MGNGAQMQQAIAEATAKVAAKGYATRGVTTKDVLLAGLGYLAEAVDHRATLIRVEGKSLFVYGFALEVLVGIIFTMVKVL